MLSNNHTPLIGHTANDLTTNFTGLYGDRQGMGVANDYYAFTPSGGVTPERSVFSYWTGQGADSYPQMDYSATVPPTDPTNATPPAPWVSYTRAGCDVGAVSAVNLELENVNPDIQNVFGTSSPEEAQYNADSDSFKDQEVNDYVGLAVHCAKGDALCANAQAVKYGQTTPSSTAVADVLPSEPGGYTGYQAVFGHKYLQPILAGAADSGDSRSFSNGDSFPVTRLRREPDRPERHGDGRPVRPHARLPGLRADNGSPDARLRGGHAGDRRAGHVCLHLRRSRCGFRRYGAVQPGVDLQGQAGRRLRRRAGGQLLLPDDRFVQRGVRRVPASGWPTTG